MITLGKSFDGGKTFIVPHPPMNGIPPTIPTACCATALQGPRKEFQLMGFQIFLSPLKNGNLNEKAKIVRLAPN